MSPINSFVAWVEDKVQGYTLTRGLWRESSTKSREKFLSIWMSPAGAPSGDAARIIIRLVMTGRRQALHDTVQVENDILALASATVDDFRTACITNIRTMGLPNGPFYTEENRVYYELNFEILTRI